MPPDEPEDDDPRHTNEYWRGGHGFMNDEHYQRMFDILSDGGYELTTGDTGEPDGNLNDEHLAPENDLRPMEVQNEPVLADTIAGGREPNYYARHANNMRLLDDLHEVRMQNMHLRHFVNMFDLRGRAKKEKMKQRFKYHTWQYIFAAGAAAFHGAMLMSGIGTPVLQGAFTLLWSIYAGWHLKGRYDAWKFIEEGDEDYEEFRER